MSIIIIPAGHIIGETLHILARDAGAILDKAARVGKGLPDPGYGLNSKRGQYSAEAILYEVFKSKERGPHERVLGVVDHDLYVPEFNFVFGIALGNSALISMTRLRPEFYGLEPDPPLFRKRLLTEAVHELGHTYGMGHCANPFCVMFFSNTLNDTDRKGVDFCEPCRHALSSRKEPSTLAEDGWLFMNSPFAFAPAS